MVPHSSFGRPVIDIQIIIILGSLKGSITTNNHKIEEKRKNGTTALCANMRIFEQILEFQR